MEIRLKRIAKRETYTIGHLYIDGVYFCDTLEDCDRGLRQDMSLPVIRAKKRAGVTAIPTGRYKVTLKVQSPRFSKKEMYQFCKGYSFFDLQDYAAKLAEETGDAKLNAIHGKLADAFGRAILLQRSFDLGALPLLPVFSLSVVLTDRSCGDAYLESYKLSAFHQLTGWGDWLSTNQCTPAGNPAGQGE